MQSLSSLDKRSVAPEEDEDAELILPVTKPPQAAAAVMSPPPPPPSPPHPPPTHSKTRFPALFAPNSAILGDATERALLISVHLSTEIGPVRLTLSALVVNFAKGWSAIALRVQELCESRGGRPGLPVRMSLMVSVDVNKSSGAV